MSAVSSAWQYRSARRRAFGAPSDRSSVCWLRAGRSWSSLAGPAEGRCSPRPQSCRGTQRLLPRRTPSPRGGLEQRAAGPGDPARRPQRRARRSPVARSGLPESFCRRRPERTGPGTARATWSRPKVRLSSAPARRAGRARSGARGGSGVERRTGRCWWRYGTARCGRCCALRNSAAPAKLVPEPPGRRPRRPGQRPACGSNGRGARRGEPPPGPGTPRSSPRRARSSSACCVKPGGFAPIVMTLFMTPNRAPVHRGERLAVPGGGRVRRNGSRVDAAAGHSHSIRLFETWPCHQTV